MSRRGVARYVAGLGHEDAEERERKVCCFFFNDTATTEIYTLSLHDALPISPRVDWWARQEESGGQTVEQATHLFDVARDRKSTRLNSSHANISYAVFCLKKKTTNIR